MIQVPVSARAHAWRAPLLISMSGGPQFLAASCKGPSRDRSSPISRISTRAQKAGRGTGALPSSHELPTCQRHLTVMAFLLPLGPKCCPLTLAIKACEEILLEYSYGPHGSSRIFFFLLAHSYQCIFKKIGYSSPPLSTISLSVDSAACSPPETGDPSLDLATEGQWWLHATSRRLCHPPHFVLSGRHFVISQHHKKGKTVQ